MDIADDADDLVRAAAVPHHFKLFADRILIREVTFRHRLVDEKHPSFFYVSLIEQTAALQRDAHGLEVIRSDDPHFDSRLLSRQGRRLAGNLEAVARREPARERKIANRADC